MFHAACRIGTVALVLGLNSAALAHVGHPIAGLGEGLAHPLSGLDHLLAMVAVGLWASQMGRPTCWLLLLTFPAVMALGAAIGFAGIPLPWVEIGIAASVFVLGAGIAFALRPSLVVSVALVGLFALVHGYAHGTELPASASPLGYGLGFLAATLALHAVGLGLGWLSNSTAGRFAMRGAGAAIAVTGIAFLII